MQLQKKQIPFEKAKFFSGLFLDYVNTEKREKLKTFFAHDPSFDGIRSFTDENSYGSLNRSLLVSELKNQNSDITLSAVTKQNIEKLREKNTFTITTGHQLCLATGPAYFIYKIISVINICEALNKKYSTNYFVPVYWMASEDHDVEEIDHLNLFNKKITWNTSQKGRVGEFSIENADIFLAEIKQVLGESEWAEKINSLLKNAYSKKTLADATRYLVNELFGKYGLVILDGNTRQLKNEFRSEIKKDIFENKAFQNVSSSSEKLKQLGYETQVTPREINIFYAEKGLRERIVKEGNKYKVLNTGISFSKEELENEIVSFPEKFSPNVVLRPHYQQKILPNAAYVGGPGELAYWLQYKAMFEEAGIPFPVLVPRNFIFYVEKGVKQKMQKLKLDTADFFEEKDMLGKKYALELQPFSLEKEKKKLEELFESIRGTMTEIDRTLEGSSAAEFQKNLKSLEALEQKGIRAIKQKNEQALKQIETIYERLFPNNLPQERVENFLRFYLGNPDLIEDIKNNSGSFIEESSIAVLSED